MTKLNRLTPAQWAPQIGDIVETHPANKAPLIGEIVGETDDDHWEVEFTLNIFGHTERHFVPKDKVYPWMPYGDTSDTAPARNTSGVFMGCDDDHDNETQRVAAMRLIHPRYGEWPPATTEDLWRLVWSKSTVQLAKDFGISDSAIGKRCRLLGVSKPPMGFWNKVAAGLEPHPNGEPPMECA